MQSSGPRWDSGESEDGVRPSRPSQVHCQVTETLACDIVSPQIERFASFGRLITLGAKICRCFDSRVTKSRIESQ
jgi:hypothetical protein